MVHMSRCTNMVTCRGAPTWLAPTWFTWIISAGRRICAHSQEDSNLIEDESCSNASNTGAVLSTATAGNGPPWECVSPSHHVRVSPPHGSHAQVSPTHGSPLREARARRRQPCPQSGHDNGSPRLNEHGRQSTKSSCESLSLHLNLYFYASTWEEWPTYDITSFG
jgi:hypothetical protein